MTAIMPEWITAAAASNTFDETALTLSAVAVVLLLILLILKELARAAGGPRGRTWGQTLNIAIVPLLLAFGIIVTLRFLDLLPK